jgi:N-acetylglucosamine-6-sulfatase
MIKLSGVFCVCICLFVFSCQPKTEEPDGSDKPNIVFILSDDHRYDFIGFMNKVPFLETPAMDRMAREGVHIQNAFVSTSLCSPSRASILTGQYTHHHGVIDNQSNVADSVMYFPQYLQRAGYETSFFGKWHMGEHHANPRKGFDYWVSFTGQGVYYNPTLNINGENIEYKDSTYISDLLTEKALEYLKNRNAGKPFFLYLSHKGVHSEFTPAKRHNNRYKNGQVAYPPSMFPPGHAKNKNDSIRYNFDDVPRWVKEQRCSWHGVDCMYDGAISFEEFYVKYCETLLGVDESIAAVLKYLDENDLMKNTIVFYMGDNGFSFGEHGLIDKRQAYEESMRVPFLAMGAGIKPGSAMQQMIQNIDIAPTILELAGYPVPRNMDGISFKILLDGENIPWRDTIYYEYFWERPFPQTPTVFAVRTNKYKYIRYHGVWDINELFDLENDPWEMNNLIRSEAHQEIARDLNRALFRWLEETNGMNMPLRRDWGNKIDHKYRGTF